MNFWMIVNVIGAFMLFGSHQSEAGKVVDQDLSEEISSLRAGFHQLKEETDKKILAQSAEIHALKTNVEQLQKDNIGAKEGNKFSREEDRKRRQVLPGVKEGESPKEKLTNLVDKVRNGKNTGDVYNQDQANRFKSFGCVSDFISLTCYGGGLINVTSAYYGEYHDSCTAGCCVPHPWDECEEYIPTSSTSEWIALKYICDGETSCEYQYRGATFVNTCTINSLADYMSVYYTCEPEEDNTQVAFRAFADVTASYQGEDHMLFSDTNLNIGGHYQPDSSIFICPADGIYLFSLSVLSDVGDQIYGSLVVGGATIARALADHTSGHYSQASVTTIAECFEGEEVWIESHTTGTLFGGGLYSPFSGYLLYRY